MRRLPLFVLPTVLFPGAMLPLHVFEPRYRQMVARCLETDRRFGVLYHDAERGGPFALREGHVGCEARILQFTPLPDGRSLMLTRGLGRFAVVDGIESDTPYAEALVDAYDDLPALDDVQARRHRSVELFGEALRRLREPADAMPTFDVAADVSFLIAGTFEIDAVWRQRLLVMTSEAARLDAIDRVLHDVIGGQA